MKFLKTKTGGLIIALSMILAACGSQVVEFPEDPGPSAATPPDDQPCADCQNPVDDGGTTPTPDNDAGVTPTEDAGQPPVEDAGTPPEQDAGQPPAEDAGQPPGEDAGQPPVEDGGNSCEGKDQSCGSQYGCCVSNCTRSCHHELVYTHGQCRAYQKCFKTCQAQCKAAKEQCECRSKEDACKSKCDGDERQCESRSHCDNDRRECREKQSCCKTQCEKESCCRH